LVTHYTNVFVEMQRAITPRAFSTVLAAHPLATPATEEDRMWIADYSRVYRQACRLILRLLPRIYTPSRLRASTAHVQR
jgi:hypothetical protein